MNLFNKEKNEIISVKLDKADVMRTALKEHGITGKTADMLMEDINKKLSDPQKEIFGFSREKTEVVYADIPNIGEYLAQSQLSQAIVGKSAYREKSRRTQAQNAALWIKTQTALQFCP